MYLTRATYETEKEAWSNYQQWLAGKIIGDPQASDTYTVEQLKKMNMVGVYAPDEA